MAKIKWVIEKEIKARIKIKGKEHDVEKEEMLPAGKQYKKGQYSYFYKNRDEDVERVPVFVVVESE